MSDSAADPGDNTPDAGGPSPEEVLAEAANEGVHCLAVPTPFAVGRVNCYLIEGDPLTLIDAGPRSEQSLSELEERIGETGHAIEDIGLVVATHQHIDHIGLIRTVAERSGAEVAALDLAVDRLAAFGDRAREENDDAVQLMLRNGVSEEVAIGLREVTASFLDWGDKVIVTRPLAHESLLDLGNRSLKVLHRPGHSPSDTVFHDEERRMAFAGDHLLSHISSNPLISRPLDGSPGRTRSLIDYNASLTETRKMDLDLMLSGHGDPILDHVALIDKRFAAEARRLEKIFGIIEERPRPAHAIAEAIWGNVALTQAYLTLSEVIGHTDILIEQGRITETDQDGLSVFEVAR
ncbi:MAG: MBL fold metallo-hydrolase [Thermoleophilia bacterium]|nr:MBL fold metallo-hydrolase [Thermoleophilia bacterium]